MTLRNAQASALLLAGLSAQGARCQQAVIASEPARPGGAIVFATAAAQSEDPSAAGREAAQALKAALGATEPRLVLVADCFEGKAAKEQLLGGLAEVLDRDKLCGGASYGMFTQAGSNDLDAVALLGIGGEGIGVSAALEETMGAAGLTLEANQEPLTTALQEAGSRLARKLPGARNASLLILIADAHSPKNQLLLDGVQSVVGKQMPVTGGCVNKNAGQNWVYFRGRAYTDSAIAVALTGETAVALAGRQAKDNNAVIATAKTAPAEALRSLAGPPLLVLAFDCGGRLGKLDDVADELAAVQESVGNSVPLFGCYCAGEFGPADEEPAPTDALSYGRGWHIMVTALGRR
jgi:hypothetical protein